MPSSVLVSGRSTEAASVLRGSFPRRDSVRPAFQPAHNTSAAAAHACTAVTGNWLRGSALADVVTHFQEQHGITFQSLSPFNEPSSPAWCLAANCKQVTQKLTAVLV